MNKKILILPVLAFAFLLPHATHAAFTFSLVNHNGTGTGYSLPTSQMTPAYTEGGLFGTYLVGLNSSQACSTAAARSGLSDSADTYCVYDASESYTSYGACLYTGCAGENLDGAPPSTSPAGSWPPTVADIGPGPYYGSGLWGRFGYSATVSFYQVPLQQRNLADMESALNYPMTNALCDYGYCPNGRATDPGYRDVCPVAHNDTPGALAVFVGPANACDVYHSDGVAATKPVATLTANPTTVVSGNTSLLTYSCSNNATAASIDNGIGAKTPAAAGSVAVTPSSSTTYTLTCTNAAGSSTATAVVSVESPLAASCSVSPSTVTTNNNATWTAAPSGGNGSYTYSWSGTDGLSGTGISVSKTYASAGTKTGSVMVTSGTQSVTQACSNNVTVSAPPPAPAPTCNLTGNPSNSVPSTLTWSSTNATSCTGGGTGFSTGGATSGSASVNIAGPYTLSCTGSGGSCSAQTTVSPAAACTNPTATITAAPNRIQPNTSTTLSWSASGVNTSCTISGPGVSQPAPAASCSVAPGTIPTPLLTTQSTYTITCDGTVLSTVIINVVPKFQEF